MPANTERTQKILARLDDIAAGLAASGQGLALIGLGSVGLELERLDDYSDLDFFAIVQPGQKAAFMADLAWLSTGCPIAFSFQNTVDGFKILYEDGIFAEMAVFEPSELKHIPFAPGRLVWSAEGVDESICIPKVASGPGSPKSEAWLVGEALSNLYVGLGRYRRGERLSALRFIQGYAVDRVIDLAARVEQAQPGFPDRFDPARRLEARYPGIAAHLPAFLSGYTQIPQSARAILAYLDEHFDVQPRMKALILELSEE